MTLPRTADNALRDAALDLAAERWRILPCIPAGERAKAPLTVHGFHDATLDPQVITEWWSRWRWPNAMIGAVVPDSLLVLDVDPRNGGSIEALETVLGPLPPTLCVMSGRNDGGVHLYYLRPPGALVRTRLPAGVDLKQTGYLIMPPSVHPATGQPYRWVDSDYPPALLPLRARQALRPIARPPHRVPTSHAAGGRQADALVRVVRGAPELRRNDLLYWAARKALEEGHDEQVLDDLAAAAEVAGLGAVEIMRTINSARRGAVDA